VYSYEKKSIALKVFHQTNSVSETIRTLGYPTRRQLYSWINDENLPSKERKPLPRIANSPEHPRNPPLDVKLDAIKRCFEHGESIKYVSEDIGYSRASIYQWRKLIYCAIKPPAYLPFLKDDINRIIYGVVGAFFSFKALKMLFTKENKS